MKKALISLLLVCFMVSCQSINSRIPLFEARQDRPISVTLKTSDKTDLKVWNSCHRRDVGVVVKDNHGQSMPYNVLIFWADSPEPEHPKRDPTVIKVLVQKQKDAFLIGLYDAFMFGQRIEKPGAYLLEFHIHCYDRKHRVLYAGKTEKIRVHIANRTFLEKRPSAKDSKITLWVRREN